MTEHVEISAFRFASCTFFVTYKIQRNNHKVETNIIILQENIFALPLCCHTLSNSHFFQEKHYLFSFISAYYKMLILLGDQKDAVYLSPKK